MKRSMLSLLLALALVSLYMPAFADDSSSDSMEDVNQAIGALTQKVDDLAKKGPSVEIHGFAQADLINDTNQGFNETVGDGKVLKAGSVAGDNGWTQFSERNSRIDALGKTSMGGWNYKGYLELDLLGANNTASEYKLYTQPTMRLRHAYLQADSDGWTILAGQWWTLFGWNMDYVLSTVTEAPVMATLYERIPQVRVQKTIGDEKGMQLQIAASAEKPDQDIAQMPNLDFGVRFILNDIKGRFCGSTGPGKLQPLSIGLSERNSEFVWEGNPTTSDVLNQNIWASAVAADILLPVLPATEGKDDPSIVITGEFTTGAGDTMPFNGGGFGGIGTIGAFGTNPAAYGTAGVPTFTDNGAVGLVNGGLTPILINSGNAQIQFFLPPSIGTIITGGYGEIYSSNVQNLGGSYNDDSNWFVNVMQDVSPAVRVGLEYAKFYTNYTAGGTPVDSRVQLSSWYRF